VPRVVIGMQKLVMYDWLSQKPLHGRVAWTDGIWAEIQGHLPECRDRGCLLLLAIDPVTRRHVYQHGDPGPRIEVDPARAGFAQLKEWLRKVHQEEDFRLASAQAGSAGRGNRQDVGQPTRKGFLGRMFGRGL
jgi:hypothetical protein